MGIKVSLKSDPKTTGTISQQLGNGFVTVFWDGESDGDHVHINDLDGVIEQDIVEILPDNRTYEFGIGQIDDDPYYATTQETRVVGKKLVAVGRCDGCGKTFPREHLMSANMGTSCPDCYDRMSGEE